MPDRDLPSAGRPRDFPVPAAARTVEANAAENKSDTPTEFKVAEKREDGTIVLDLGDGRMSLATLGEGVDEPRKGSMVRIQAKSYDDGVPVDATVTGAA